MAVTNLAQAQGRVTLDDLALALNHRHLGDELKQGEQSEVGSFLGGLTIFSF